MGRNDGALLGLKFLRCLVLFGRYPRNVDCPAEHSLSTVKSYGVHSTTAHQAEHPPSYIFSLPGMHHPCGSQLLEYQ